MTVNTEENRAEKGASAVQVAEKLVVLVTTEFSPGAQLPSEADLAERFEVSRLTLREAMKVLIGRGLLDVGRGRRAVVREPDGSGFGHFLASLTQHDPKGRLDLIEMRMSLEVHSASLAARRASRAAIVALETALDGMRREGASYGASAAPEAVVRFHEFDYGFHEALAMASGNRVIQFLLEAMADSLKREFEFSLRGRELRGHSYVETISEHQHILDCVKAGKVRASGEAMRLHLKATEIDIMEAVKRATL